MTNGKGVKGKSASAKAKPVTLDDIRDELRTANRLMIATLAMNGIQQKDIATVIDRADSVVSEMFPKGTLKRLARPSKKAVNGFSD